MSKGYKLSQLPFVYSGIEILFDKKFKNKATHIKYTGNSLFVFVAR